MISTPEAPAGPTSDIITTPPISKQNKFTCICCRIKFESASLQRVHFKSDWHLYNLKRKVCSLEPLDLENFLQIQAASTSNPRDDEMSVSKELKLEESSGQLQSTFDDNASDTSDDWEEVNANDLSDDDYNDDEISELISQIIKSNTCLFCDKKSSNMESNLTHMDLIHGFFIPEDKYLIDADGMMEYLGFKVGASLTCLWCSKQFKTLHGVRRHMITKDHCKIYYDQERATGEFKEYYDYSTQQIIEMAPTNKLVVMKKPRPSRYRDAKIHPITSSYPLVGRNSKLAMQVSLKSPKMISGVLSDKRSMKKFSIDRAKFILRNSLANNQNYRHRFKPQNPI